MAVECESAGGGPARSVSVAYQPLGNTYTMRRHARQTFVGGAILLHCQYYLLQSDQLEEGLFVLRTGH